MTLPWLIGNNGSLIPSSGTLSIIIKNSTLKPVPIARLPLGTVINDNRFSGGLGGLRLLFLVFAVS